MTKSETIVNLRKEIKKLKQEVKDAKYFGSDYNKFLNKKCTKTMTCINIDTAVYKRAIVILRLCESKNENEKQPNTQKEIHNIFANMFKFFNEHPELAKEIIEHRAYNMKKGKRLIPKFELWYIIGNASNNYRRGATIINWITDEKIEMNAKEFKKFSEFKKAPGKYIPRGKVKNTKP